MFTKNNDGTYTGRQTEVLEDGQKSTITVDDAYIKESIAKPNQKKVVTFETQNMTPFDLDELRVRCIIDYMKSLADQDK